MLTLTSASSVTTHVGAEAADLEEDCFWSHAVTAGPFFFERIDP